MLSFFFDGVPLPESMRVAGAADGSGRVALTVVSHKPYEDGACGDCHGTGARFGTTVRGFGGVTSQVCMKCHEGVGREYPYMHGPVAAMHCLTCHEPHMASYPHLLREGTPQLCLGCHEPELLVFPGSVHEDVDRDCLDCHSGHGGHDPTLLKEGAWGMGNGERGPSGAMAIRCSPSATAEDDS